MPISPELPQARYPAAPRPATGRRGVSGHATGRPGTDRPPAAGRVQLLETRVGRARVLHDARGSRKLRRGRVHARRDAVAGESEGARGTDRHDGRAAISAQRGSGRHPPPRSADADRRVRAACPGDVRPGGRHLPGERAADHARLGSRPGRGVFESAAAMGRPACAMLPQAAGSQSAVASVGCIGNRVYTELGDDEMYLARARGRVSPVSSSSSTSC